MATRLAESLFAHAEAGLVQELRSIENLESLLENFLATARSTWPGIDIHDDDFMQHIATHLASVPASELAQTLSRLFAADLFLALACARGNTRALAHFDRVYLQPASLHVRASKMSHVEPADVEQLLREKLFVADAASNRAPKIALYAGRGPLAAWVRVAATRTALSVQRSSGAAGKGAADRDAEALLTFAAADNPEMEHVRAQYSDAFRLAFHDALHLLSAEERNVLRLTVADGLSAEAVARIFGVHRATVTRRLASARDALFVGMRKLLAERLQLDHAEFESLMGTLLSQFDVSVQRVLHETKNTE
ncbi:sigma factor-like helix-turn-helix DNA-binding protein [Pendulispora albinea]|uniref:Transcriptional regulator n=1 Tax=Pendulispora albinea TaxID=2741071 RepID=A0ABZ2MC48_9BACT